jgi:hypothetical protein
MGVTLIIHEGELAEGAIEVADTAKAWSIDDGVRLARRRQPAIIVIGQWWRCRAWLLDALAALHAAAPRARILVLTNRADQAAGDLDPVLVRRGVWAVVNALDAGALPAMFEALARLSLVGWRPYFAARRLPSPPPLHSLH